MTDQNQSRNRALAILGTSILVVAVAAFAYFKWIRPGAPILGNPTTEPGTGTPEGTPTPQTEPYSIGIELSDGQSQPQTVETNPVTTGNPLTPEEIQDVLSRLPSLQPDPNQQVLFNLPQELVPPPQPGNILTETFPPTEAGTGPVVVEAGPVEVTRFSPEGDVPLAPYISVTFNQPMVPVGTLSDLSNEEVPVKISPSLPGTWRWLGTKTLTFNYDSELIDRMPMATEYTVTVPAGVQSANGTTLAAPVTWTFKTPPPTMTTYYPSGESQPLDPIFFIAFDQRIDPAAVLKTIKVQAGFKNVSVVLATQEEIDADEQVKSMSESAEDGRWLAFRAAQPFPADTQITVDIEPNTPSAEGPLTTPSTQSYSFSTYAPLKINEYHCSWYSDQCPPLTPFDIIFNNQLDMEVFSESMVKVDPEIPGMTINAYGNTLEISGETAGRTTYTVTISGKIQDVFGQTLGKDEVLKFKVDKAEPLLIGPGKNFLTLDPTATKPVLSVYAINYKEIHIKVYSVQPSDWPDYLTYLGQWQQTDNPGALMPGKLVSDRTVSLNIPNDALTEVGIDLSTYLSGNYGHLVVIAEPPKGLFESDEEKYKRFYQTIITWVQVTQIGLDAYNDHSEMVAWATDLKNGSPLSGIQIQPNMGGNAVTTGKDGTVRFPIPDGATYLVATKGADQAILPHSVYYWGSDPWTKIPVSDSLQWYVFDDRQMYKPGEEVHLKGWMRRLGNKQDGDVGLVGGDVTSVTYQVTDLYGNAVADGQAEVNALGGFDFAFTLPQVMNLGYTQIILTPQGNLGWSDGNVTFYHGIQVQEFRRPEFEVTARNETTGPYFAGDKASLAVEAKYYAGGGLPNADVTWSLTTTPSSYSPPNWEDFTFGSWTPWWYMFDYAPGYPPGGSGTTQTFTGKTDATGTHYLNLTLKSQGDPTNDPQPYSIVAQGTVMDVNRQAWSSTTTLLVHPADVYIGLKSDSYFVEKGTPIKVDFIVTDIDGNPISDRPVEITAGRMEYKYKDGNWVEQLADSQTCTLQSTPEPATCSFDTPLGGSYKITAIVTDEQGRKNQTQFTRWVSGGQRPAARNVEQEQVTLIPDKENYQPGDTAKVLVQSPFSPAEGLLTVSRNGFLYTSRFEIKDGSTTLNIPIEEKYIPNLTIQVDLVGSAPRTDDKGEEVTGAPPRPAFATGQLNLNIPPIQRTLEVELTPDQTAIEPGAQTNLNITVKDARGLPVSDAELAVVVVDESILALTNYQLSDPLSVFYITRSSYISSIYGRNDVVLANPQTLARDANSNGFGAATEAPAAAMDMMAVAPMATAMPGMGGGAAEEKSANGQPGIVVRADFNPLATFAPSVKTDLSGHALVQIKVPDNLTRYRIMVVAVDNSGKQFGSAESNITARLPLMVRPSAPRFLNFGDKFELPVILQNQTDSPMTVDVVARALNLNLANMGQQITIPANDRVEIRFPASTIMAGSTQIQIGATAGDYADAATVSLPVYTPATSEAFATYGVIDDGAIAQPVLYPTDVIPQYGGLEVSTSSTALQSLTDAVLYLVRYPYECSEQLASRVLAVASLRDVLTAFKADGLPTAAEMESSVGADVKRLSEMQNYDGGFPYWRRGFESVPFNTIHVTHALIRAQQKGYDVPADMEQNALNYLSNIESYYPSWYSQDTRWTLSAYALYVRNLAGDRDAQKAEALLKEAGLEHLSMEAIGWLWTVVDDPAQLDAIRLYVNNHVVETAGAANFTTSYSDQTYLLLSSDRRTDAILLDALMEDDPQSDLIVKVVNGLMAHRSKGHWGSTQEDVFVLLALDRYFNTYEAETPNFVARMWLGDTYAGSNDFIGRTTDIAETLVPMDYVLKETSAGGGTQDLIVSKEGDGRLYYRIGLQYAPTELTLDPLDMGFVVQRVYEGVDNPDDVKQDENGMWHIKAGARVRVKITMVAENRRYHVALVDPLPAGLEIINPELAVSQSVPQDTTSPDYKYGWWWWGPWYEHQNMRDNRAEAFTSLLWDGVYNYTYVARATTPGTFIVPPTKAEEMYSPEVFGRSGSDTVIVE